MFKVVKIIRHKSKKKFCELRSQNICKKYFDNSPIIWTLFIFVLISISLDRMTFIFLWRWTIAKKVKTMITMMMQTKMLKIGITITPHIHMHYYTTKKKFSFPSQNFLSLSSSWTVVALRCYAAAALKWDSLCHFWILLRFCLTFFSKNAFTFF